MSRILGIDPGTKYLGVALSDSEGRIAFPKDVIRINGIEEIVGKIIKLAREYEVAEIVIGLPIHLSAEESEMSLLSRKVAQELREKDFSVTLYDERLTSIEAERTMHALGEKPSRNKLKVNKIAASIILQSYLDSRNLFKNEEID